MNLYSPLNPPLPSKNNGTEIWHGLKGSSDALAVSRAATNLPGPAVVVSSNTREFDYFVNALRFYSDQKTPIPIYSFSSWGCLPYDAFSPRQDITSNRLSILSKLPALHRGIVVINIDSLIQCLPPTQYIKSHNFSVKVGDKLNIDNFRNLLFESAYKQVPQVEFHGEYAVRGGVIDVFPMGSDHPVRIELFDEEVDTLRCFLVDEQRSFQKVDEFSVLPGSEIPLTEEGITLFRQAFRQIFPGDPKSNRVYRFIDSKKLPEGAEFYMPLFFNSTSSFFDYLPDSTSIFVAEDSFEAIKKYWKQIEERFQVVSESSYQQPLNPDMLYLKPEHVKNRINFFSNILLSKSNKKSGVKFNASSPLNFNSSAATANPYDALKVALQKNKAKFHIAVDTAGQMAMVKNALKDTGIKYNTDCTWHTLLEDESASITVQLAHLPTGLNLPEADIKIVTSADLFGASVSSMPSTRSEVEISRKNKLLAVVEELNIGDPVVHEIHGIGRYNGLETMNFDGFEAEFMVIQYYGTDKLYVPVYSVDWVNRYVSIDKDNIPLHSLSSKKWAKAKKKAQQKAYDIASELLEVQALREAHKSPPIECPPDLYSEFTAKFPYNETVDQLSAERDVLADMSSKIPMDRLVCGDAGFGKTEIALRCAFTAVANNCQVAIIVPTTVLAQQHYDVFSDRFAEWGTKVGLFSRLQTGSQLKKRVSELNSGSIDIAIGTTRLIQSDVKFKNLGLLIIDEEHRFGVRQKEHLKQRRTNVNVLSLSATPIPRTLSMALNRLREISIIATPPENRLAVHTFFRDWSPLLIREACLRELGRGGQIFYVHNEVKSISRAARNLAKIVPEADIRIAHGQMSKVELGQVMKEFYQQKFNTLVCTTIIESGLDIPTANTILINAASKFGLAQLYQLRGRVGRSYQEAFAYFLVESKAYLAKDAKRRLDAIESLQQLGAGYAVATYDLEIRGAGTILGEAQSGAIDEIGYTLYSEYLSKAVDELNRGITPENQTVQNALNNEATPSEVNLNTPTLIPENWIPDVNLRLTLYKRIASARAIEKLRELRDEMKDRFGSIPAPAEWLLRTAEIRILTRQLGIEKLDVGLNSTRIKFSKNADFNVAGLVEIMNNQPDSIQLKNNDSEIQVSHCFEELEKRVSHANELLLSLTPGNSD